MCSLSTLLSLERVVLHRSSVALSSNFRCRCCHRRTPSYTLLGRAKRVMCNKDTVFSGLFVCPPAREVQAGPLSLSDIPLIKYNPYKVGFSIQLYWLFMTLHQDPASKSNPSGSA